MARDKYKAQFAHAVAKAFRQVYPEVYREAGPAQVFDADFGIEIGRASCRERVYGTV